MAETTRLPAPLLKAKAGFSKRDFGHVLIIAGSPSMLGACALCSWAAMRSGSGLVTAAVPRKSNLALQKKIPDVIMTLPLDEEARGGFARKALKSLEKAWDRFDALAIGPGLGRRPGTLQLAREVIIQCPKPLVVDADALFALAGHEQILLKALAPRVLTPHAGEMSRLVGLSAAVLDEDRLTVAREFALAYRCVLLLKGPRTIVASSEGKTCVNRTGNVGLATAGSGDVLTGIITSFLGQGNPAFNSAAWGAYYHGRAAERVARLKYTRGMTALDICENIPYVLKNQ